MLRNERSYHEWAQTLSDDEWCEFLAGTPVGEHIPPPLPPEEFQRAWVGNTGKETFREAIAFCQLLKSTMRANGLTLGPETRLLDIGVGWGRIYRVLLRETPHLIGIDPVPNCIELCRSALPTGRFEVSPCTPPYQFEDGEFDVVYLYSVFSHVNETLFRSMLREAARVVRDGGLVVFTTLAARDGALPGGFPKTWREDVASRRFVWVPTGGAHESMPPAIWGWALISEAYLRQITSDFPLKVVAYNPDQLLQAFVALRKG